MNTPKNFFPKLEMDEFYAAFQHKLRDWFRSDTIISDGKFSFTQLIDTNKPNSVSFCESEKYINLINKNKAITCAILRKGLQKKINRSLGMIISENPRRDFFTLHNTLAKAILDKPLFKPCIKDSAKIHPTAYVDKNCHLGEDVFIGPGALILNNSYIDDGAVIGPNVVIGSEALEYNRQPDGKLFKVSHMGGVYIDSDVEIMSNAVVSKDVYLGFTIINSGTKIGPLCNIAHRVKVGKNCCIAGNTTVGGSTSIGNDVWVGPSATISNGIQIGDSARVSIGSVVVKDVKAHQTVSGFFAVDHAKALKLNVVISSKGK